MLLSQYQYSLVSYGCHTLIAFVKDSGGFRIKILRRPLTRNIRVRGMVSGGTSELLLSLLFLGRLTVIGSS